MPEKILRKVEFDPRLPHYFLLQSSFGLLVSFIGIPLLPFWLLGLGQYVHRRQFEAMEAELTERSLNVRRGFLFRTQKNVPLDKITDLAVNEGPILRKLGLWRQHFREKMLGHALHQLSISGLLTAPAQAP